MNLEPGEVICNECEGKGRKLLIIKGGELGSIEYYNEDNKEVSQNVYHADIQTEVNCEKCGGKGKLDWIEAVVGVKKKTMADLQKEFTQKNIAAQQQQHLQRNIAGQQQHLQRNIAGQQQQHLQRNIAGQQQHLQNNYSLLGGLLGNMFGL